MAGWLLGLFHHWVVSRNGTQGGFVHEVKPFDGSLVMPVMKEVLVSFNILKAASLYRHNITDAGQSPAVRPKAEWSLKKPWRASF